MVICTSIQNILIPPGHRVLILKLEFPAESHPKWHHKNNVIPQVPLLVNRSGYREEVLIIPLGIKSSQGSAIHISMHGYGAECGWGEKWGDREVSQIERAVDLLFPHPSLSSTGETEPENAAIMVLFECSREPETNRRNKFTLQN